MDVFDLRDHLIGDFSEYAKSFMNIADERLKLHVETRLDEGLLWPEPKVQLNPAFKRGGSVEDLVGAGVLHPECARIFRRGKKRGTSEEGAMGTLMHLHQHQEDAIRIAREGDNYVLTTGTGSGKSLAYIVPIVDHVLRRGSGKGIQAIIVYPMNALANSQDGELQKFLGNGYPTGAKPVTWRRYTGQESDEERKEIIASPPDILLTNYVMLELILTRPEERRLVDAMRGLQYLVFDELHTYRGRQGADVALLMRRVRDVCEGENLQHVGTSATLAGTGTVAEQKADVASLATTLFGSLVRPECVVGETLRRATGGAATPSGLASRVVAGVSPRDHTEFINDALASWIEQTLGLREEAGTGSLLRQTPMEIPAAAAMLAEYCDVPTVECAEAIRECLMAGYEVCDPETGMPVFAFRLHQFISRGDTVYATLESPESRHVTTEAQRFAPGTKDGALLPLAFCRECGQEYYVVQLQREAGGQDKFLKRELRDREKTDSVTPGYLYVSSEHPWPDDDDAELVDLVPQSWLEEHHDSLRIKSHYKKQLPKRVGVRPDGALGGGSEAWFVPAPFRFCLKCGVTHSSSSRNDFGKLATLGTEARSTATTILAITALRNLKADDSLTPQARKLLSFTDNRQDAALQAGHFNDFVEVGLLRSGLFHAAEQAGAVGLGHEELTQRVMDAMGLTPEDYAAAPDAKFSAERRAREALLDVIGYRLFRDLQRGWRLTSPNLEQCGLLQIGYEDLGDLCRHEPSWAGCHETLLEADATLREEIAKALLDHMRRVLAIKVQYLDPDRGDQMKTASYANLRSPWDISDERLEFSTIIFPRSVRKGIDTGEYRFLSGRSGLARYMSQAGKLGGNQSLRTEDREAVIQDLLRVLASAGLVEQVVDASGDESVPGYQLQAAAMRWVAGDGTTPAHDPVRVPRLPAGGAHVNEFFVEYYRTKASTLKDLHAAEHTAQVQSQERERREQDFREARLPLLFCSPTMELGVDISELNCVNMRNVPPTPANYAQRSGRAGRSGQPALVFTYCSAGSPHDQYYFRRPGEMVSGQVKPPRLDLSNEDLLRSHVHSIWIREASLSLGRSLNGVLEVEGDEPTLELLPKVRACLEDVSALARARDRALSVLSSLPAGTLPTDWNAEQWLDSVMRTLPQDFEEACGRWRGLYLAARAQAQRATRVIHDASSTARDKNGAKASRAEAEAQLDLLLAKGERLGQSDFYSYRYFASEGFLPGYNFPRLPLSAFIPGRSGNKRTDEFLSRPRFLAISEFGPRAYVYHEGQRYQIVKAVLPVEAEGSGAERIVKRSVKLCDTCGYMHEVGEQPIDVCAACGDELPAPIDQLFRLTNVGTKRRDRINSDEEERQRQGFEIKNAYRFAEREGTISKQVASASEAGEQLAKLSYGHSATMWRMNLGLRRRKDQEVKGFLIDPDTGWWAKSDDVGDTAEPDTNEPKARRTERVVPFVEDRRNCLVLEPAGDWGEAVLASLAAALKNAIQVEYQLEDSELAVEPLPDRIGRRTLLFYEAAEGGAGVLRRLVEDSGALPRVAARALEICHFDAAGHDLGHALGAKEPCTAACYDCLMSYSNQPDHELLDRNEIRDVLLRLSRGAVATSPTAETREAHFERLIRLADSQLEQRWLRQIRDGSFRLPTEGQPLIEAAGCRPDFLYRDHHVAVFIDGPHHDDAHTAAEDLQKREKLENIGYTVVAFRHDDDWATIIARYPEVFGGRL